VADLPLKSGKLVVLVAWLFLCCCRIFWLSPLCSNRQTASRLAIKVYDSKKHLWAFPHPQPLKKVDQTFKFGTDSPLLFKGLLPD